MFENEFISPPVCFVYPGATAVKIISTPKGESDPNATFCVPGRQLFKKLNHFEDLVGIKPKLFDPKESRASGRKKKGWIRYGEETIQDNEFELYEETVCGCVEDELIKGSFASFNFTTNKFDLKEARFLINENNGTFNMFCKQEGFFIENAWVWISGWKNATTVEIIREDNILVVGENRINLNL